jgi:hypothetical protein
VSRPAAARRPHTRAYDRRTPALDMLGRRRAWRVGPSCFQVFSRDGLTAYRVLVTPAGETSCTCTAGRFGGACWHQIRALKRALREGLAA